MDSLSNRNSTASVNEELLQLLKFYQMTANNNLGGPANQKFRNEFLNLTTSILNGCGNKTATGDVPSLAHPLPVMTPRDQSCDRMDTLIRNEIVSCFLVGGEKRLCFPQFVNSVLNDFEILDINRACVELNIHCSLCTKYQLEILKLTNVLPMSLATCNLITNTDAERLCSYLTLQRQEQQKKQQRHNNKPTIENNKHSSDSDSLSILIKHRCFGRCKGRYYPAKFTCPQAMCIQCVECSEFYSPDQFVSHTHGLQETRYCHWGFDSANWRAYIQLKKEFVKDKQCVEILNEMKCKFINNKQPSSNYSGGGGLKRSAVDEVPSEKIVEKRPRIEPVKLIVSQPSSSAITDSLPSSLGGSTSATGLMNLTLPTTATSSINNSSSNAAIPLLLCDPLLALAYYHLLANARLSAAMLPFVPTTSTSLSSDSQVPPPLSMEEAAAALLKLAPQKTSNDADIKPIKSKTDFLETVHHQQQHQQQQHTEPDVLKKHIFDQLIITKDQPCLPPADVSCVSSSTTTVGSQKVVESEDLANLELLLMHYVRDSDGLRRIFDKLRSTRRCHEEKVETLMAQNRILHQEIAYLRNRQNGCSATTLPTSKCLI